MCTQYGFSGQLEVFNYASSEPDGNPDDKKLEICGKVSSVTFFKQKRKRNSLQLPGEDWDVGTENDLSKGNGSKEQNVPQQLNSKHTVLPRGSAGNTKNNRNCSWNVGTSFYPKMIMIDDQSLSHERQSKCLLMERLEKKQVGNGISQRHVYGPKNVTGTWKCQKTQSIKLTKRASVSRETKTTKLGHQVPVTAGPWRAKSGIFSHLNIHCCNTSKSEGGPFGEKKSEKKDSQCQKNWNL